MPDDLFKLGVAILATWRISCFLYYDRGPFDLFDKLREVVALWSLPKLIIIEEKDVYRRHYLGEFVDGQLHCFWCVSIWVGLFVALIVTLPSQLWYGLLPFALSGAAVLLSGGGRTIWRLSNES